MRQTLIIESLPTTDRNITLLFKNRKCVGINYWCGCGDMSVMGYYLESDEALYKFISKNYKDFPHSYIFEDMERLYLCDYYYEFLMWVDSQISNYLQIQTKIEDLKEKIKTLKQAL